MQNWLITPTQLQMFLPNQEIILQHLTLGETVLALQQF